MGRALLLLGAGVALSAVMADPASAAERKSCAGPLPLIGSGITIDPAGLVTASGTLQEAGPGDAAGSWREIEFAADTIEYNADSDVVTATGNVVLMRQAQTLKADQVIWNRGSGDVRAEGNVRIVDEDGNTLYGDSVTLTDSIRDGVIENILLVLDEGGRLVARRGERKDGFITLDNAAYSPCNVEDRDGNPKDPSWQIRAIRVVYDPGDKRVRYTGARLELFGLPVIPLPGLSHPVGRERGTGLLVPDIRFSEANGIELEQPYYFDLAPNRDLTVTGHLYSEVLPMVSARYRALNEKGAYQVRGYATASSRIPVGATVPAGSEDDFRGYFEASGRFQLDPHWSLSGLARVTTDRTFLRRYDISREDRLRSTIKAERIGDRSYFSLAGWATQTLRVNDPQGQVPVALPELDWRYRLADPVAGGQVELQINTLAIGRSRGQDTQRAFASARWDLRHLTGLGQQLTLTAYGRGDVYNSNENALSPTLIYRGEPGLQARASATFAIDMQWPFVGPAFGGTQTLTPRVQIVASPSTGSSAIPNEDSRAIELEDSNLFALARLPGYDRIEDGVRLVYGLEWMLRRPGLTIRSEIGQSQRFNSKTDQLPAGTGLAEETSDIVGRTEIKFRNIVAFTHRYRLDKSSLGVRRNEIDATFGTRGNYVKLGYLRLNRDIGPGVEDLQDREEARVGARMQITDYWSMFGSAIIDLSNADEDPTFTSDGFEPIRTRLGIAYEDDCLELGFTWRRDYIATGDAQRGNTFLLRVALRNLGF